MGGVFRVPAFGPRSRSCFGFSAVIAIVLVASSLVGFPARAEPATGLDTQKALPKPARRVSKSKASPPRAVHPNGPAPLEPWALVDPHRAATPKDTSSRPLDDGPAPKAADQTRPVDLGLKWNGNNATAAQTRTQNYGGDAVGSGAEVGMKFHF